MNRRSLLTGAAAGSIVLFGSQFGRHRTSAQAPAYTSEVIFEFTELAGESYSPFTDGYLFGVSSDGVLSGRLRVDGKQIPVTWDLSGAVTQLDTGDRQFVDTSGVFAGLGGIVVGSIYDGPDASGPTTGIVWTDGVPTFLEGDIIFRAVNGDGMYAGSLDSAAARWTNGTVEQLALPSGATWSAVTTLAENGDGYGAASDDERILGLPFIWKADGSVEEFAYPDELSSADLEVQSFNVVGIFENGDTAITAFWKDGEHYLNGAWLRQDGIYTPVPPLTAGQQVSLAVAPAPDRLFGSVSGQGEAVGPTEWIDGMPYLLKDVTSAPDGVRLGSIRGVTDDGVVIATNSRVNNEGPAFILALHPAG